MNECTVGVYWDLLLTLNLSSKYLVGRILSIASSTWQLSVCLHIRHRTPSFFSLSSMTMDPSKSETTH